MMYLRDEDQSNDNKSGCCAVEDKILRYEARRNERSVANGDNWLQRARILGNGNTEEHRHLVDRKTTIQQDCSFLLQRLVARLDLEHRFRNSCYCCLLYHRYHHHATNVPELH